MDTETEQQMSRIRHSVANAAKVRGRDLDVITGAALNAARKAPGGWGESRQAWGRLVEAIYEPSRSQRGTRRKAEAMADVLVAMIVSTAPECVHPDRRPSESRVERQERIALAMADGAESA